MNREWVEFGTHVVVATIVLFVIAAAALSLNAFGNWVVNQCSQRNAPLS